MSHRQLEYGYVDNNTFDTLDIFLKYFHIEIIIGLEDCVVARARDTMIMQFV